jgi:hypothetical protein
MAGKLTPTPPEMIEHARQLFFDHVPINDIARQLKLSSAVIAKFRNEGGWSDLRRAADDSRLEDSVSRRKVDLMELSDTAVAQMKRSIKAVVESTEPPTLQQAKILAEIVQMTDKVHRLDRQVSTENISVQQTVKVMTPDEVRAAIAADPFFTQPPASPKAG